MKHFLSLCCLLFGVFCNRVISLVRQGNENIGHWFSDLLFYHGKTGVIHFNCEPEHSDGLLVHWGVDDHGRAQQQYVTFRIPNRWVLVGLNRPNGETMLELRTQAALAGYNAQTVQWHTATARRVSQCQLDMSGVSASKRLARRTARLARFHWWLIRWFPAPVQHSYHPREHTDVIVRRT